MKKNYFLLIFLICCSVQQVDTKEDLNTINLENIETETIKESTQKEQGNNYYVNEKNIPIVNDLHFNLLENCIDFIGSLHKVDCLGSYEVFKTLQFDDAAVNIFKTKNYLYIVLKGGKIFEFNFIDQNLRQVFQAEDIQTIQETGLLSIAINKQYDEFVVSYVNTNFELIVDKYKFKEDIADHTYLGQIFSQQLNKPYTHIGGNLIWSDYFNTYLLSVGDNQEANEFSRVNPAPLDTTNQLGKILALENVITDAPLIYSQDINEKLTNIVVYGLRSPWQFFEYNGYLAVFDVGLSIHEEMTISKLSDKAVSYGWPIFEGGSKAKIIDNIENYEIEITYVLNNSKLNNKESLKQLESESLMPNFFYSHFPTENDYRGAIIGGDIILDDNSIYDLNIVSTDIITNELFLYDIQDATVKIVPPPTSDRVTITNIRSLNNNFSDLVIGTFEGKVIFLNLP